MILFWAMHLNFEFKAKADNLALLQEKLNTLKPRFAGEDLQTDTYFNVPNGRLKLREGNIENSLIQYQRSNTAGAKSSHVILYAHQQDKNLKAALQTALGVKVVVVKKRNIYFVENVKIHFDVVEGLGTFVEVEAIDKNGTIGIENLKEQCAFYISLFAIQPGDFVAQSYSDLLIEAIGLND